MLPEELKKAQQAAQEFGTLADEEPAPIRRRKLKAGEFAEVPEIGIPGAKIHGTEIWVDEYEDGTLIPIIPAFGRLLDGIFRSLVTETERPLSAPELVFLRRFLKFTQDELAERVGVVRETICRMESGKQDISPTISLAVRHLGLLTALNELPAEVRDSMRPAFARLQNALTASGAVSFHIPDTETAELTIVPTR